MALCSSVSYKYTCLNKRFQTFSALTWANIVISVIFVRNILKSYAIKSTISLLPHSNNASTIIWQNAARKLRYINTALQKENSWLFYNVVISRLNFVMVWVGSAMSCWANPSCKSKHGYVFDSSEIATLFIHFSFCLNQEQLQFLKNWQQCNMLPLVHLSRVETCS